MPKKKLWVPFLLILLTVRSCARISDGLLVEFSLDGNTADGQAGNLVDVVSVGKAFTGYTEDRRDRANSSAAFNGSNDAVTVHLKPRGTTAGFSLVVWVFLNSIATGLTSSILSVSEPEVSIQLDPSANSVLETRYKQKVVQRSVQDTPTGRWVHIATTLNFSDDRNPEVLLYLDGKPGDAVEPPAGSGVSMSFPTTLLFGANVSGRFDDVGMYGSCLTKEEVVMLANDISEPPVLPPAEPGAVFTLRTPYVDALFVHETGVVITFELLNTTRNLTTPRGISVAWPGGGSSVPNPCQDPCIEMTTNVPPSFNPTGFAATFSKNPDFLKIVHGDDKRVLGVSLSDGGFRAYAPMSEDITVKLPSAIFPDTVYDSICTDDNGEDRLTCKCNKQCIAEIHLQSQPSEMPNEKAVRVVTTVGGAVMLGTAGLVPASVGGGGAVMKVVILTMGMYCPKDGRIEVDRLTNPFRLQLGDDPKMTDVNGAVLSNVCMQILVACLALMFPDRSGWISIPLVFLFGSAAVSCTSCVFYSSFPYNVIAATDLAVFPPFFLYYVYSTCEKARHRAITIAIRSKNAFFTGALEWVEKNPDEEKWMNRHKLVFDCFKPGLHYLLLWDLGFTAAVGVIEAYEPLTHKQCRAKSIVVLCFIIIYIGVLAVSRGPYLATYETVFEMLILIVEMVMTGCIITALGVQKPTEHWSAATAGNLAITAMNLIVLKLVIDILMYISAEHRAWQRAVSASGRAVSFVSFFFRTPSALRKIAAGLKQQQYEPQPDYIPGFLLEIVCD